VRQRRCTTPASAVLTGWDRPLRSRSLIITARHTGAIADSHLDDAHGPGLSLRGVRQWLATFGILPPATLPDDRAADRHANAGHLRVVDDVSGDETTVAIAPPYAAPRRPSDGDARLRMSQDMASPAGRRRSFTRAAGEVEPRRGRSFPGRCNQSRGERSPPRGGSVRPRYR
jgi:hypothetical protein